MRIPGDDTDRPWRKSRLAARILFRKEAGRMTARDQRIGRRLAQDPEAPLDVGRDIVAQALARRRAGYGEPPPDYQQSLAD